MERLFRLRDDNPKAKAKDTRKLSPPEMVEVGRVTPPWYSSRKRMVKEPAGHSILYRSVSRAK